MPLQPIKSIAEYKRLKDTLRERFEVERTGDQDLLRKQTKIFEPLINTQREAAKTITDGQESALLPYIRDVSEQNKSLNNMILKLQQGNDESGLLAEQPFSCAELPEYRTVDLDAGLNDTDRENLQDLSLDLPSKIYNTRPMQETLEKIKPKNRSIGQKSGHGPSGQKVQAGERKVYESQRETIDTYKKILEGLNEAIQFVSTPKKVAGKGLTKENSRYPGVQRKTF